jgi:fibronectin-binding autotransporter adhesin
VNTTISGPGGRLVVNNTNNEINVRQATGTAGAHRAILNLSELDTFVANLSRIRVGDGEAGSIRRAEGQLILAKTNTITLVGPSVAENVQLIIGNNDVNNNGNGSISSLVLGQENTLNVDQVLVGARKQQGNIHFLETLVAPRMTLRGSDGVSRVKALRIGDESDQSNSGNGTTGRIDLSLGTSDIKAETVIVGKGQTQTGASASGFLVMGVGTLDANDMEIAYQTSETANAAVSGSATFLGTAVTINNRLRLGRFGGAAAQARNATLNVGSGASVTVVGSFVTEGTATVTVTNGMLTLPTSATLLASALTIDGGTVKAQGTVKATNSLTIVDSGKVEGNPVFDMGTSATAVWDVSGAANGTLTVSNAFRGGGTLNGNLAVAAGAKIGAGSAGTAGALTVSGNLNLSGSGLQYDLSNAAAAGNDQIFVSGALNASGVNTVTLTSLGGSFDTASPYTLITAGSISGGAPNFAIGGALAQSRYTFSFGSTANSITMSVGGTGPSNLTWVGGGGNLWDVKGAANWSGGSQFYSLDAVTFNDSGAATVTLTGQLQPGSITVNNVTKNLTFSGTGFIEGGALTKSGAGSLTISNSGSNSFGAITVQAGSVELSNSGQNTIAGGIAVNVGGSLTLGGDSSTTISGGGLTVANGASVTISSTKANSLGTDPFTVDGSVTINQAVDSTIAASISGAGTLTKNGSGTLSLAADNSGLGSVILVKGGTLRAAAVGSLGLGVTVEAGGSLNINGLNVSGVPIVAAGAGANGQGAILNTGAPQAGALGIVTLKGDTTFGGTGQWNTDPVLNAGLLGIANGTLSTEGQARTITKVGKNQLLFNNLAVDAALGDILVSDGLLALQGSSTLGDSNKTITVQAGATVSFHTGATDSPMAWDKNFVLFGNGTTFNLMNYLGPNTVNGTVALNGNVVIGAVPADRGTPQGLTLAGVVSGSGALTKTSADALTLTAANTYTGDTTIQQGTLALSGAGSISSSANVVIGALGTLDASARTDAKFTVASGQTLKGNGNITGDLLVSAGSTLSPGTSIGSLTVSGAATLSGTTSIELDAATDTNDVLSAASIAYGGTLNLTVTAGTLAAGDAFKIFSAGSYSGSFTISPASAGAGLAWDTSTLTTDGTLRVKASTTITPRVGTISLNNGNLVFSGTGGLANGSFKVVTSTDVALPIAQWTEDSSGAFDASGNFSLSIQVQANTPKRFYMLKTP